MQTLNYQGLKINKNTQTSIEDVLVVEAPLQININKEAYTVIMRTPDNDEELVRGLLFAEDIYKSEKKLIFQVIKEEFGVSSIINVNISKEYLGKGYLNKRTLLSVSSCGICGKKELKDIKVDGNKLRQSNTFLSEEIPNMYTKMILFQDNFKNSGGSHAADKIKKKQELLSIKEDIGRHNAVDKTIGYLLIKNKLKEANYLLVSGRVSYEI
ncbi:MAG: formate dehydrogenase accessory sulfurtransferase FdhD, partial [Polaribacter sp.]